MHYRKEEEAKYKSQECDGLQENNQVLRYTAWSADTG